MWVVEFNFFVEKIYFCQQCEFSYVTTNVSGTWDSSYLATSISHVVDKYKLFNRVLWFQLGEFNTRVIHLLALPI
jgi:hypothetical protein